VQLNKRLNSKGQFQFFAAAKWRQAQSSCNRQALRVASFNTGMHLLPFLTRDLPPAAVNLFSD